MKFTDSAEMPIIAIDFDGTINIGGESNYPMCGRVRPYAKKVMNFMHKLGIKIVIWTSRDVAYNQEERRMYDHLTPMLNFLKDNDVHYDAINKSIQFAPYAYNGRKVYAHMYVDDRAFGWEGSDDGNDDIFLKVLDSFLRKVCSISSPSVNIMIDYCCRGQEPEEWMMECVKSWKLR